MTTTVSLSNPRQIPGIVAGVLGFVPADSLVIVGTGGGPTARIDIGSDPVETFAPFAPAFPHWVDSPVLVVIYSDDPSSRLQSYTSSRLAAEGVDVAAVVRVTTDGRVHQGGNTYLADEGIPAAFAARRVAQTREALLADAANVTDAQEAYGLAVDQWNAGNGAHAWVFLDRYAEILGHQDSAYRALESRLVNAVDPRSNRIEA